MRRLKIEWVSTYPHAQSIATNPARNGEERRFVVIRALFDRTGA